MNLSIYKKNIVPQVFITILLGIIISYQLIQVVNPLFLIAIIGVLFLVILAIVNFRAFITILIITKPFIDLTVNVRWLSFGGISLNSLEIIGIFLFFVLGYHYFTQRSKKEIFNERVILVFLGLQVFISFVSVSFNDRNAILVSAAVVRLFDAYFIYFIFHQLIKDDKDILKIFKLIWISTVLVGAVSSIAYIAGTYNIDISRSITRFAGFYNDPGSPSYLAVISLIFGTLYLELLRIRKQNIPIIIRVIYWFTIIDLIFMLRITLTKSAMLMAIVFLIGWWGVYKRKIYFILPLIIIIGFYAYSNSQEIRNRLATEIEFFTSNDLSYQTALSMGSGRIARWDELLKFYEQKYTLFQKFFGDAHHYGAHNQYIAYLLQIGFIGLTIFLIILFRFYKRLLFLYRKLRAPEIYMGLVFLTVFAVYGLTGHPFDYTTLLWYLMILLSLINVDFLKYSS